MNRISPKLPKPISKEKEPITANNGKSGGIVVKQTIEIVDSEKEKRKPTRRENKNRKLTS